MQQLSINVSGSLDGLPPSNQEVQEAIEGILAKMNAKLKDVVVEVRTTSYPDERSDVAEPKLIEDDCKHCPDRIYYDSDDEEWFHVGEGGPIRTHSAVPRGKVDLSKLVHAAFDVQGSTICGTPLNAVADADDDWEVVDRTTDIPREFPGVNCKKCLTPVAP